MIKIDNLSVSESVLPGSDGERSAEELANSPRDTICLEGKRCGRIALCEWVILGFWLIDGVDRERFAITWW